MEGKNVFPQKVCVERREVSEKFSARMNYNFFFLLILTITFNKWTKNFEHRAWNLWTDYYYEYVPIIFMQPIRIGQLKWTSGIQFDKVFFHLLKQNIYYDSLFFAESNSFSGTHLLQLPKHLLFTMHSKPFEKKKVFIVI